LPYLRKKKEGGRRKEGKGMWVTAAAAAVRGRLL
jgi:hypothetical protein